jgi:hypothetical protein
LRLSRVPVCAYAFLSADVVMAAACMYACMYACVYIYACMCVRWWCVVVWVVVARRGKRPCMSRRASMRARTGSSWRSAHARRTTPGRAHGPLRWPTASSSARPTYRSRSVGASHAPHARAGTCAHAQAPTQGRRHTRVWPPVPWAVRPLTPRCGRAHRQDLKQYTHLTQRALDRLALQSDAAYKVRPPPARLPARWVRRLGGGLTAT